MVEEELSAAEVGDILLAGQAELYFLLAIQFLVHVLWQLLGFIPGVCPLENASSFNAVCHTGFWVVIDLFVLAVGIASIGFGVWSGTDGTLVKDVRSARQWLTAWVVVLFVGIVAHVVHIVAASMELSYCTTTLCTDPNTQGYLVSVVIGIAVLLVVEALMVYRALTFRHHIQQANAYHSGMFTLATSSSKKTNLEEPLLKSASIIAASASIRATPLVSSSMRHGLKRRE